MHQTHKTIEYLLIKLYNNLLKRELYDLCKFYIKDGQEKMETTAKKTTSEKLYTRLALISLVGAIILFLSGTELSPYPVPFSHFVSALLLFVSVILISLTNNDGYNPSVTSKVLNVIFLTFFAFLVFLFICVFFAGITRNEIKTSTKIVQQVWLPQNATVVENYDFSPDKELEIEIFQKLSESGKLTNQRVSYTQRETDYGDRYLAVMYFANFKNGSDFEKLFKIGSVQNISLPDKTETVTLKKNGMVVVEYHKEAKHPRGLPFVRIE